MINSILDSVKKVIGITSEDTNFDEDLIMHINSEFNLLKQLGVSDEDFYIEDNTAEWGDYLPDDGSLNLVKTYIYLRAKKLFDPPTGGHLQSLNEEIDSRLIAADFGFSLNLRRNSLNLFCMSRGRLIMLSQQDSSRKSLIL